MVDIRQAATALHVSHDTILRAIHTGRLHAQRTVTTRPDGRVVNRFEMTAAALAAYVDSRRTGPHLNWTTMAELATLQPGFRTVEETETQSGWPTLEEIAKANPPLTRWWLLARVRTGALKAVLINGYRMDPARIPEALALAFAEQEARVARRQERALAKQGLPAAA